MIFPRCAIRSAFPETSYEDRSTTEEGLFKSTYGMGRRWRENLNLPSNIVKGGKREVTFESVQDMLDVEFEGTMRGHEKRGERGTTNHWRKFGALRKLKAVGGYAPKDYKESKTKEFEFFSEKSRLPSAPSGPELTLNRDKRNPSIVACVKIGDKPAAEEAHLVAKEVDWMVQKMSLDDFLSVKKDGSKKKNSVAAKINRSGVGGLFRRLSGSGSKKGDD